MTSKLGLLVYDLFVLAADKLNKTQMRVIAAMLLNYRGVRWYENTIIDTLVIGLAH